MNWFDAHNHLQDARFGGRQDDLLAEAAEAGVRRMVVNGSGEDDWGAVAALARRSPLVLPSFGCHPWYLRERTERWREALRARLEEFPGAGVGEIGIDGWLPEQPPHIQARYGVSPPALDEQEAPFVWQLELAAELDRPATIHCLGAFGRLRDLLSTNRRPARGFLLHSYGGPAEMVPEFARLGAYFSFPGYFGHDRKEPRREAFRRVPAERLLVETDAPDQLPPEEWIRRPAPPAADGRAVHHPANLPAVYELLAQVRGAPLEGLARQVEANFTRLFGPRSQAP